MSTIGIELPSELVAQEHYPNRYAAIVPNGQVCPYTGLKHAKLYDILKRGGQAYGAVRVANLREPGAARGKTLFHVGDMLRFLDSKAEERIKGVTGE